MGNVHRPNYPIIDGDYYNGDLSKVDEAMISFIKTYGTHYAKSTIMGIGVFFETRYNEQETRDNSKQHREECSTVSGAMNLFGLSIGSTSHKCNGSLEDTTKGFNTKLKRFISDTYGTLPVGQSGADSDSIFILTKMAKSHSIN